MPIDHSKFEELVTRKRTLQRDWLKTSTAAISTLLGIIIAFNKPTETDCVSNILFSITISAQSLCILFGLTYLYSDSDVSYQQVRQYIKQTQNLDQPLTEGIVTYEHKFFVFARTAFFVFLVLSILSLAVYSIYSRFN